MIALPKQPNDDKARTRTSLRKLKTLPKEVVWQGRPSLVLALDKLGPAMIVSVLMVYIGYRNGWVYQNWMMGVYAGITIYSLLRWTAKVITLLCIQYTITNERLLYKHGVFNRITDEIELFRVRDFQIQEPLFLRPWGLGNVVLITADRTHPEMIIEAVPETARLHSMVRELVRQCWIRRGVYEVDAG